jgi:MoxR-like ATPase
MADNTTEVNKVMAAMMEVRKAVIGKDEEICKVMMAFLAGGHVLIEDIPGVGKTTMANAFAKALGLSCNRMHFTPDVMPSDIVGFNMYNKAENAFEYKSGAVDCNIFLADEINRTSPKTQSALLQVMEEGKTSVDGKVYQLPKPFMVIATQNPYGFVGTQSLPESQLDRFMIKINMGYPGLDEEIQILKEKQKTAELPTQTVMSEDEINDIRRLVEDVYVDDSVYEYVARLARATREKSGISQGLSPRGSIALLKISKAQAFLRGRDYCLPSDVRYIFGDVVNHRLILDRGVHKGKATVEAVSKEILNSVAIPKVRDGQK